VSLVVVGLNHRTAPVELLERMAVPPAGLRKALHSLAASEHLTDVVLLSTCNRTEVYVRAERFHAAVEHVRDFLTDQSGLGPDDLAAHLYAYHDDAAVAHLFGVAAGIDSMIVGEGEVLGQVREAGLAAEREGAAGTGLARLFRHAVEAGKRSRTETGISRHAVSVSSAAVALATERIGSLSGRTVLVLGAGEVGEGMAIALAGAGAGDVVVVNRSRAKGRALAQRVGGRAIGFDEIPDELAGADVLLTSTSSTDVIVERGDIEAVMERRDGRALLVVDVAVPRDVDPGVAQVFGVTLLDIDDLRGFGEQSLERRRQEIGRVRQILAEEVERFRLEHSAREVAPLVARLRDRGEELRERELARFEGKLAGLDPAQRDAVEALTRGIVNKLLHEPTVRVKDTAGTDRGERNADALVELFDLDDLAE
jgi:glutamyl-tRNA reductase